MQSSIWLLHFPGEGRASEIIDIIAAEHAEIYLDTGTRYDRHAKDVASVPGLPRSVRVLIMRMRKRQTFEERGRPRPSAWAETSREGRRGVPGTG